MSQNRGGNGGDLAVSKIVNKFRKDARNANMAESVVNQVSSTVFTHELETKLVDGISGNKNNLMKILDWIVTVTHLTTAKIKKFKASNEYSVLASMCRILPITHFVFDKRNTITSHPAVSSLAGTEAGNSVLVVSGSTKEKFFSDNEHCVLTVFLLKSKSRVSVEQLEHPNHTLGKGNLIETIASERRMTARNIERWTQQLLTTLLAVHANYMTVGDFGLADVYLDSDDYVISALEQLRALLPKTISRATGDGDSQCSTVLDGESIQQKLHSSIKGGDDRNAWLDVHDRLFDRSPHPTASDEPRSVSPSRDKKTSVSPSHRTTSSAAKSIQRCPTSGGLDWDLLLQFDAHKTGAVSFRDREPKERPVLEAFEAWMAGTHRDARSLGIIVLQMISHRVFTPDELRHLRHFNCEHDHVAASGGQSAASLPQLDTLPSGTSSRRQSVKSNDQAPTSHDNGQRRQSVSGDSSRRGSVRRSSVLDDSRRGSVVGEVVHHDDESDSEMDLVLGGDKTSSKDEAHQAEQLAHRQLESRLADDYPALLKTPEYMRELVVLCFQPLRAAHRVEMKGKSISSVKLECELFVKLQHISGKLQAAVLEHHNSIHAEKVEYWTYEDEQKRLKAHRMRSEKLQRLAEEGVAAATQRVRAERFKLWYSNQSDEYRAHCEHVKMARARTAANKAERRLHIYLASPHVWPVADFQRWLSEAVVKYLTMLFNLRVSISKLRKKKPEVFATRIVSELFTPLDQNFTEKLIGCYGMPKKKRAAVQETAANGKPAKANPAKLLSKTTSALSLDSSNHSAKTKMAPSSPTSSSGHRAAASPQVRAASPSTVTSGKQKARRKISDEALLLNVAACIQILAEKIPAALATVIHETNEVLMFIRAAQRQEKVDLEGAMGSMLVTSPEQLFHKRMSIQAGLLVKSCKALKKAVLQICEEIGSMDRDWAKQVLYLVCLSIAHQFEEDLPVLRRGEQVAALKITAFFQMIHIQCLVKRVWQRTEVEFENQQRKKRNTVTKPKKKHNISKSFSVDGSASAGTEDTNAILKSLRAGPSLASVLGVVQESVSGHSVPLQHKHHDSTLTHRSFALGSDITEPLAELPALPVIPHVMYAAQIQESLVQFDQTLQEHYGAEGKKATSQLPAINVATSKSTPLDKLATSRTATPPANIQVLKQPEPISVIAVVSETDTLRVDLAVNLLGDGAFKAEDDKKTSSSGAPMKFDYSREYYKYDDWKTVTCVAYVRVPSTDETTSDAQEAVGSVFVASTNGVQVSSHNDRLRYNPRPSTLPLLSTDQHAPDKLFDTTLLADSGVHYLDEADKGVEMREESIAHAHIERVTKQATSAHLVPLEVVVVMYSRKQIMYNMYSKSKDEFQSQPDKYRPVPVTLTVLPPPPKHDASSVHFDDQSSAFSNSVFSSNSFVETCDYSTLEVQCLLQGVAPNRKFCVSVQLDEYLAEEVVGFNRQYFQHLRLTEPLPAPPTAAISSKQLVLSTFHLKQQLQKNKELSLQEVGNLRHRSGPKVHIQYVHRGLDWLLCRSESSPKCLTLQLVDKVRTNSAIPGTLPAVRAETAYLSGIVDAASAPVRERTHRDRKERASPKLTLYFQLKQPAEHDNFYGVARSFTSYSKVHWNKCLNDRQDRTTYQLQRRVILSCDQSADALLEGVWEAVTPMPRISEAHRKGAQQQEQQLHHVHNYFTDCIHVPACLGEEALAFALKYICAHFADLLAAESLASEKVVMMNSGVRVNCAYRVRAVNSFGSGKYSRTEAGSVVDCGHIVIDKNEFISSGFYKPVQNSSVMSQMPVEWPQDGSHRHQGDQRQGDQRVKEIVSPDTPLRTAPQPVDQETLFIYGPEMVESSNSALISDEVSQLAPLTQDTQLATYCEDHEEEDEETRWLRELSLACPLIGQ